MTISDKLYKILIAGDSWKTILGGLWVTVQISVFALLIGTVQGALICLIRTRRNRVINNIASRTMQPLLTIIIGMLIYLAVSYIVFAVFAISDRINRRKRGDAA